MPVQTQHVTCRVPLSLFASVPHSQVRVSTQETVGGATASLGQGTLHEPSFNLVLTLLDKTKTCSNLVEADQNLNKQPLPPFALE